MLRELGPDPRHNYVLTTGWGRTPPRLALLKPMDPMFSAGDAYERFMGRWSRRLAPLFVRFAGIPPDATVLDVGCGTGALTEAVLFEGRAGPVIAIDASAPYVAFARKRFPGRRARFQVGDAQQLPLPLNAVDTTLSLLILNLIPDRDRAVREMLRVTRPGGSLAAAVWDYGQGMQMLRILWDEAVAVDAAADQSDERHMPLCREGELHLLWRASGLQDVEEQVLSIDTPFSSFDDYWLPFLEGQGPAGAYVAALPSGHREQLERRLRQRLLGNGPDGPILLRACAWAVRGVVP